MKKIILLYLVSFQLSIFGANSWCDSTLALCDSLEIDTIFIANDSVNGDWIHLRINTEHGFLYAPSFIICPDTDTVAFVDDSADFFGIFGPASVNISYRFQDFDFANATGVAGDIVADNSNNLFVNCQMPFSFPVNPPMDIDSFLIQNELEVLPNPTDGMLTISWLRGDGGVGDMQLFNVLGEKQKITTTSSSVNLSSLSPGLYVLCVTLYDEKFLTKKIIKR